MNPKRLPSIKRDEIAKSLKRYYSQRFNEYCNYEDRADEYRKYINFILKSVNNNITNKYILEFGCASNCILNELSKNDFQKVMGLDFFSEAKLREYREKLISPNIEMLNYNGNNFPLKDSTFDIITSFCVLEHVVFVEKTLDEMDRILKPGGYILISAPNWSGINSPIRALQNIILCNDRYWHYYTISDSILGIVRSIKWYLEVLFNREQFIMVYPKTENGFVKFERTDDDVVHLCQPLSFKKYFKKLGYKIIKYNRFEGESLFAKYFNTIFPSFATRNYIVVQKSQNI